MSRCMIPLPDMPLDAASLCDFVLVGVRCNLGLVEVGGVEYFCTPTDSSQVVLGVRRTWQVTRGTGY